MAKKKFYEMEKPTPRMQASARHKGPGPSDAGQSAIDAVGHMGGTAAKSLGHAAHDVKHGIGKAVGKIGGIFG